MSDLELYHDGTRALQDAFDSRRLADRIAQHLSRTAFTAEDRAFIERQAFFLLATADAQGWPDCSYKGGVPGFVRVADDGALLFPSYDGNGMFRSLGNLLVNARVGLLFIDFESPHRVRVQGTAQFLREHPVMAEYAEAQYLVLITVSKIWVNCPRYIHKYKRVDSSKYVPQPCKTTPLASWKRLDLVQDALSDDDRRRAEQEGVIELPEYEQQVARGEG